MIKVLNVAVEKKPFFTQQLEELKKCGVEYDLITVPGNRVVTEEYIQSRTVFDYLKLYPEVLRHSLRDYDIIHSHYGLTAPFVLAQPNRPVVMSLWGRDLNGEYGWLSRLCAKYVDATIVRNEEMKSKVSGDAYVVERGVNLEKFHPMNQVECQEALGWEPTTRHVLFPYSPSRSKKNYHLAKSIVKDINNHYEYNVEIHAVYNEPHDKIPIYMNAADVLLMTSDSEGSPNSIKEALACNLPVVSTDVGDVPQLLSNIDRSFVGSTEGILKDYILEIFESDRSSIDSRNEIQEMSWDRTCESIMTIYESVL